MEEGYHVSTFSVGDIFGRRHVRRYGTTTYYMFYIQKEKWQGDTLSRPVNVRIRYCTYSTRVNHANDDDDDDDDDDDNNNRNDHRATLTASSSEEIPDRNAMQERIYRLSNQYNKYNITWYYYYIRMKQKRAADVPTALKIINILHIIFRAFQERTIRLTYVAL